jgi:hypothetical protein
MPSLPADPIALHLISLNTGDPIAHQLSREHNDSTLFVDCASSSCMSLGVRASRWASFDRTTSGSRGTRPAPQKFEQILAVSKARVKATSKAGRKVT